VLEALEHQDLPFEKLLEELKHVRDLRRTQLFQVLFQLRSERDKTVEAGGLTFSEFDFDTGIARLDLALDIIEKPQGLWCFFQYNTDYLDKEIIKVMGEHFRNMLEGIVAGPEKRLSELPLLTEPERYKLLVEWNETRMSFPGNLCVHQLIEAQVERNPDAAAVALDDRKMTYGELNNLSNQLAHSLRRRGVGPDVIVGIFSERSIEMVVGMIGIMKAGGAYLPIDPSYPKAWIDYILDDAKVPIILTQERLLDNLAKRGCEKICLDSEWEFISRENEENPVNMCTPENLAYVIYTSGSTGRPKGVMIPHIGICNYLLWRKSYFPLSETDKLLQNSSYSFDDSVWEFFEPLMVGAEIIMLRPGMQKDIAYLVRLISDQKITAACFVPSMLHIFLDQKGVESCDCLKRVTTGGEPLTAGIVERFFNHLNAELHNGYGPTEATIGATFWTCKRQNNQEIVPIGHPISNTQVYILDKKLNPVPIGTKGEIYIGGIGLSRGYLNQPEITAEKFIPNPFSQEPGARLYYTGDLGRYLPDCNIEFLGRTDYQVKVRGYRIELGDIETVLERHPLVKDCVLIVKGERPDDKRLIAYVVPSQESSPSISDLLSFLRERLPEYMVPSAIIMMDGFPLTSNGKLDRSALPEQGSLRAQTLAGYVGPTSEMEIFLANIWKEVIGIDRVGIYDNFLTLEDIPCCRYR